MSTPDTLDRILEREWEIAQQTERHIERTLDQTRVIFEGREKRMNPPRDFIAEALDAFRSTGANPFSVKCNASALSPLGVIPSDASILEGATIWGIPIEIDVTMPDGEVIVS